jgi:hypothetical protein
MPISFATDYLLSIDDIAILQGAAPAACSRTYTITEEKAY